MKNIKGKIMTVVVFGSIVTGASMGVFAADATNKQQYEHNWLQTKLDSQVASGTITSEKEKVGVDLPNFLK